MPYLSMAGVWGSRHVSRTHFGRHRLGARFWRGLGPSARAALPRALPVNWRSSCRTLSSPRICRAATPSSTAPGRVFSAGAWRRSSAAGTMSWCPRRKRRTPWSSIGRRCWPGAAPLGDERADGGGRSASGSPPKSVMRRAGRADDGPVWHCPGFVRPRARRRGPAPNEALFRLAVGGSFDAFFILRGEPEGPRILHLNASAESLLGCRAREAEGHLLSEFSQAGFIAPPRRARSSGGPASPRTRR